MSRILLYLLLVPSNAWARPLLVRVQQDETTLVAPVVLRVAGAERGLQDEGAAPDARAGDGVWSGLIQPPADQPRSALELEDARGRRWTGEVDWPSGDPPELDLALGSDGSIQPTETTPFDPASTPSPSPGASQATPATETSGSWAWAVAALGWGLALSEGLRRFRRAPRLLSTMRPPLEPGLYGQRIEQAEAALALLLRDHRVLLLGDGLSIPEGAPVFGPDSSDPGDVAAALRALEGRGRPLAVLVGPGCPFDLEGLLRACRGVPLVILSPEPVPGERSLRLD